MQLRNCILIALAFDASQQEIEHAHNIIDRVYGPNGNAGGVDPKYLVGVEVKATDDTGKTASGLQTTEASSSNVQLDKDGLPWDERIHSSSKAMTEKGVWRVKRGLDDKLKTKVEAELRATLGATPTAATAEATVAAIAEAATPSLPPMPGAPALPSPAALPDPAYTALVQLIAQNTNSAQNPQGRITDDWVKQVLTHYGVAEGSLQNLAHNPALIPQISDYIKQALAS